MAFYSCQHATRIVILYVPILPLVRFWHHSIHIISIQQTVSELGDLETTLSISIGYKLKLREHFYQCNCPDHHTHFLNAMTI